MLGVTLARQRHLDEGIAEIERALTIWERRPPAVPIERLNAMHQVVNFHRERGALDDAIQAMERAIEYTSHLTARDHAAVGAELRDLSDRLRQQEKVAGVIVGSIDDGRAYLVVNLDESLVDRGLDASKLVRDLGRHIGGGGGGRPTLAEAGGKNPAGLRDALEAGKQAIAEALK